MKSFCDSFNSIWINPLNLFWIQQSWVFVREALTSRRLFPQSLALISAGRSLMNTPPLTSLTMPSFSN